MAVRPSLLVVLLAQSTTSLLAPPARSCSTVLNAQVGSSSRSRAFTKTGPRKPQSPRPEQYPNEQKLEDLAVKKRNIKYDPEYADDIARAKRRLFDLRMRKSQRLPFKSSEFRELRRFVARLKTQQREDELRAAGVDLKKNPAAGKFVGGSEEPTIADYRIAPFVFCWAHAKSPVSACAAMTGPGAAFLKAFEAKVKPEVFGILNGAGGHAVGELLAKADATPPADAIETAVGA